MPLWVDLSEHQVSLNVYNSPNGKRIILRKVVPHAHIPPEITELGFELHGDNYERRDLQFSLPQLRKFFPLAASREFSMEEIFARAPDPVVGRVDDAKSAAPAARAPWHVTRLEFVKESFCRVGDDGRTRVVFDDIEYLPNLGQDWTTKKAKEEVHARLVKNALVGHAIDPFPPSLPPFKVILDYPGQVYAVNQRAEKNISRLLAQLDVSDRLLDGDDVYFRIENPPYTDLVVERLPDPNGDRLYLTHYLRSNGDSTLDAEMVFEIRKNGTLRLAETATQNPIRGGELRGRDVSFANIFSKNLLDQGFAQGNVRWPRDERENDLGDGDDLASTVFAVGQRVRFSAGIYEGSEGAIEAIEPSGRLIVRGDRGTGFGVTADEAVLWGLQVLDSVEDLDPVTPKGYAFVMADEALQLKHQDTLDAYFAERIVALRNALHDLDWKDDAAPGILKKTFDGVIASAAIDVRQVGAGRNVVGIIPKIYTLRSGEILSIADDLTGSPKQLAARLESAAFETGLKPAPVASPESHAEKIDAAQQAKFGRFNPAAVRTPTAVQLGLGNKTQTQLGEAMLRLFPGGWSNGHMLELGRRPKLVTDAVRKYYGSEQSADLRVVDQISVDRIINTAKASARIKVEPIATFDDEFVVRGAVTGSGLNMNREKDQTLPINVVVLCNDISGLATQIDRRYFSYFASTYKGCEFLASPDGNSALLVKHEDRVVGVAMPIRVNYDMRDMLKRAFAAKSGAPVPEKIVSNKGKVKVYGAPGLAASFSKTLHEEIAALEKTLPGDPAFRHAPMSDAIKLMAYGDRLDVLCTDRGSNHVVSVVPLATGKFQAHHGSAESCPTSLLTAVLWASSRIEELRADERKASEAKTEPIIDPAIEELRYRTIKVYIDGFRHFVPAGLPIGSDSLMKAIEPFVSDPTARNHHLTSTAKFLGSGAVSRFELPENATLELISDDVLRLSASGYTCEILATEPTPAFDDERPWIQRNHEKNAPMSFVGALSSASAWLRDNQAWEAKKSSYPDGGKHLEELARQYATFLREGMPSHHDGIAREMHRSFAIAILNKDVDYLAGWIARSRGQNELSKKYFTKATGCKLPATIRDITSTLYAWAGFTPEQAAARKQEKEVAHESRISAQRIDDDIEWCGNALSNTRVNHGGQIKSTKQFMDEIIAQGFTEIRKYKAGAVDRYSLVNPDEQRSYLIKGKMVTYAKAVLTKSAQQKEHRIELEIHPEEPQHTLRP